MCDISSKLKGKIPGTKNNNYFQVFAANDNKSLTKQNSSAYFDRFLPCLPTLTQHVNTLPSTLVLNVLSGSKNPPKFILILN